MPMGVNGVIAPSNLRGKARKAFYDAVQASGATAPGGAPAAANPVNTGDPGAIDRNAYTSNMPTIFGGQDLQAEADKARADTLAFLTKDVESNRQYAIEQERQRLANQGIDPSQQSYQLAIKSVNDRFDSQLAEAKANAVTAGNQTINTLSGASSNAVSSYLESVLGLSDAELKKYGIDKNTLVALKQIQAQKEIARMRNSGGGGDSDVIVGGLAP